MVMVEHEERCRNHKKYSVDRVDSEPATITDYKNTETSTNHKVWRDGYGSEAGYVLLTNEQYEFFTHLAARVDSWVANVNETVDDFDTIQNRDYCHGCGLKDFTSFIPHPSKVNKFYMTETSLARNMAKLIRGEATSQMTSSFHLKIGYRGRHNMVSEDLETGEILAHLSVNSKLAYQRLLEILLKKCLTIPLTKFTMKGQGFLADEYSFGLQSREFETYLCPAISLSTVSFDIAKNDLEVRLGLSFDMIHERAISDLIDDLRTTTAEIFDNTIDGLEGRTIISKPHAESFIIRKVHVDKNVLEVTDPRFDPEQDEDDIHPEIGLKDYTFLSDWEKKFPNELIEDLRQPLIECERIQEPFYENALPLYTLPQSCLPFGAPQEYFENSQYLRELKFALIFMAERAEAMFTDYIIRLTHSPDVREQLKKWSLRLKIQTDDKEAENENKKAKKGSKKEEKVTRTKMCKKEEKETTTKIFRIDRKENKKPQKESEQVRTSPLVGVSILHKMN